MNTVDKSDQRMYAFKDAAKRQYAKIYEGQSTPSGMRVPWNHLTEGERLMAKAWVTDQVKAAISRLDVQSGRAWVAVYDRIKKYPMESK